MAKRSYAGLRILLLSLVVAVAVVSLLLYPLSRRALFESQIAQAQSESVVISKKWREIVAQNRQKAPIHVPVLIYHYVENVVDLKDTIRSSLAISPATFESQILTLITYGYTPIRMSDISNYYSGASGLPEKPVVLSFDDGYRDFYTDVLPILRRYYVPATLYMVSGFMDSTKNYLTSEQLREISRSGLVEIGAHTINHSHLSLLSLAAAQIEIHQSKKDLETFLGVEVEHFAFPYGEYTPDLVEQVRLAGFLTAVTTEEGMIHDFEHRFLMKRVRPGSATGDDLIARLK